MRSSHTTASTSDNHQCQLSKQDSVQAHENLIASVRHVDGGRRGDHGDQEQPHECHRNVCRIVGEVELFRSFCFLRARVPGNIQKTECNFVFGLSGSANLDH